jgi:hypothetical protein
MKPYCVVVVKYVLPAMRVMMMNDLIENHGFRKIEVADKMAISPAAVTQYSRGSRGSHFLKELSGSKKIMEKISEMTQSISNDEANIDVIIDRMCEICGLIRNEKLLCNLHMNEFPGSELDDCMICLK